MKPLLCVSALLASTTFLWADPSALLIANEDYSNLGSVRYGDSILGAERDLRRAGMVVEAFDDLSTVPLLTELGAGRAERRVVGDCPIGSVCERWNTKLVFGH